MASELIRFRFGGHATFPLRYGWLTKGLGMLRERGRMVPNLDTADELGLGSKMVESLAFWMESLGLVAGEREAKGATDVAELIWHRDPYLELPGSWWFLHLNLARTEGTVWSWFFNDYQDRAFDRESCTHAFLAHANSKAVRPPSLATVQRDVACLLSSYGTRPGTEIVDPEDVGACPFRELGLVVRDPTADRYQKSRSPAPVPPEVFLAAAAMLSAETGKDSLSLRDLANARQGPGRLFGCSPDRIDDMLSDIAATFATDDLRAETLLGERHLRVARRPQAAWMTMMYERVGLKAA